MRLLEISKLINHNFLFQYLLKQGHLRPSEEQRLVFSLGTVLSLLPKETILKYLKEVVSPYIVKLDNILSTIQVNLK